MARLFTHANELLLRHLFETLDGAATTGPQGFSGSFEKRLATCTQQPLTSSKAVRLTEDLSYVDPKKLSTDLQHLLEICNGINADECHPKNYRHWSSLSSVFMLRYASQ